MSKEIDKEVIENYRRALTQKYNAVCLDIDGTVTEKGKKTIDPKMYPVFADLLTRNVPLVFITGRGETGLEEFKNELVSTLRNIYGIKDEKLRKIYVLVNDGARLFKSNPNSSEVLTDCEYISSEEAFKQLDRVNQFIISVFSNSNYRNYYDISYSKDSKTGKIINIRLNIKINDDKMNDDIYRIIKSELRSFSKYLNITEGNYQNRKVMQIGVSKKAAAVRKVEQIIGIPKNSMLLVGDRGDEKGNDYSMLDFEQGFSVQYTSKKKDKCFPILDEDNHVLTGTDATTYLLTHAKILPTICLEKVDKGTYRKNYAGIERRINAGRINYYNSINWKFNNAFNVNNGFTDIFDIDSGSVIIPMYEWELIDDNNPLKQFFSIKDSNGRNCNILRDDMNIMLRGSKNYYYLLANRLSVPKEDGSFADYTSSEDVLNWINNYIDFVIGLDQTFYHYIDFSDSINKRLVLGALDNLRNICLVCINSSLNRDFDPMKCNIINMESIDDSEHIKRIYNTLLSVHDLMIHIFTEKDYYVSPLQLQAICSNILDILEVEKIRTLSENDEAKDYSKIYRAYRELDNFAEEYLTTNYVKDKTDNTGLGICGISYGGIELPILYKSIFTNCDNVLLFKFPDDIGHYRNKHSVEIRRFGLEEDKINMVGVDKSNFFMISDDNILTAKTIQLAINIFYDLGLLVNKVMVVRYPSINRLQQMTMYNHGAADYNSFFNYIEGLLFPSPYSYRDLESKNQYLDSLGVFDLNREKILKCLYKNHDYRDHSEVAYVRKKI